ncbi:MAG TPA: TetR/AcrR family transcriptional regulator [Solirubrobacteraceae bacterium]
MPADDSHLSLRDEQKALTRRRLIDAAEVVFARHGFHGASVEEVAREAGATTGALYSNFASKEALFLALFEHTAASDVQQYSDVFAAGATPEERVRGVAELWMRILRERPDYFPLIIEFWAYAVRQPRLRSELAARFASLRSASAQMVAQGADERGIALSDEFADRLGLLITSLGNGFALQKLIDPEGVPDELYGEILVLIFNALAALVRADHAPETTQTESPNA